MKPLYKEYKTSYANASLVFNLVAILAEAQAEMQAAALDRLCIRLVRPGISGSLLLSTKDFAGNKYTLNGDSVNVDLLLLAGRNRLTIEAEFGTNTRTLAIVDIETTAAEAGTFETETITTPVVKQVCDGVGVTPAELAAALAPIETDLAGKADGQIYRVGESGDPAVRDVAKIRAHSVEVGASAEATGLHAIAAGNGITNGDGAVAFGLANKSFDAQIIANGDGALVFGRADEGEIVGESAGSQANGHSNGGIIIASGDGSHAHGSTDGAESNINAYGNGSIACGSATNGSISSDTGGIAMGVASNYGQITAGYDAELDILGTADVAIGVSKDEAKIIATMDGAVAIGFAQNGDIKAIGRGAVAIGVGPIHAGGSGTVVMGENCRADADHVFVHGQGLFIDGDNGGQALFGRFNASFADRYCFVVGNGTNNANRSNAFAIDWDGNLVLFNNGTPVVLTPAKLAQLIA